MTERFINYPTSPFDWHYDYYKAFFIKSGLLSNENEFFSPFFNIKNFHLDNIRNVMDFVSEIIFFDEEFDRGEYDDY